MPFQKGNQLSKLANHKSAGRKPELTKEEHALVNRLWGETVIAAAKAVKTFVSANGVCDVNMTSRAQVATAMKVLDKHFPSAAPEVAMEEKPLDPHVLPPEVIYWLQNFKIREGDRSHEQSAHLLAHSPSEQTETLKSVAEPIEKPPSATLTPNMLMQLQSTGVIK